ncbi:MAG: S41 family peptidase, partial [Bacteroidales bacterium]|nr:S41 family peptidase [Bacteroidales bacterium]
MNRFLTVFVAVFFACAGIWAQEPAREAKKSKSDAHLDAQQYLEILGASMQTLQQNFVDSIDWGRVLRAGIDAMMMELDPYTQFYSEDDQQEFKQMTTGEYAGIGSIIQQRGDTVVISEPYEHMPAAEAGLKIGDRILAIDGENMVKKTTSEVSDKLRGQPNTTFKLKVLRPYEGEKEFDITRRQIVLDAMTYYGWLNDSIAYIQLSQFTDKATIGTQTALLALREDSLHNLKGLVLDLRNNPGGLLDEAVKIVGMFVPHGSMVVETRGRQSDRNSTYRTNTHPIEPELPIVCIVNRSSASASEILSGALQDLDRAVVLGERSFGKGLVQTSRPLPYNTIVKFTSAKYYIPSGRCVQAIDYQARRMARWEQNQDESVD